MTSTRTAQATFGITLRLSYEQMLALKQIAGARKVTVSEAVRQLINEAFNKPNRFNLGGKENGRS